MSKFSDCLFEWDEYILEQFRKTAEGLKLSAAQVEPTILRENGKLFVVAGDLKREMTEEDFQVCYDLED